ncbi:MAG: hypothetical protein E7178_00865 [Erysipelotrichaceae bacterium]|nr:hypothetical protein [Erysipelotrichaceae bacterium]
MGINNRNYNTSDPTVEYAKPQRATIQVGDRALNMAKVYGYLFLALLFTGGIAFGVGYLFSLWMAHDIAIEATGYRGGMIAILMVSAVGLLILSFVVHGVAFRNKHSVLPYYIAYVLLMGTLLSTFTMFIDWRILGVAFGITSLVIGLDAVIALFAKSNFNWVAMMGLSLLLGAGLVFLFSWLMILLFPGVFGPILYIIDFVVFVAIVLLTLVDIVRITKIAEQGEMTNNLALYCSFIIYTDFIYIFIRIVYYIAIFSNRR